MKTVRLHLPFFVAAFFAIVGLVVSPRAHAAPGDVDSLDANIGGNSVTATAVQPDGKIIIGGDFTSVRGVARNNIARLNVDGSLDAAFDPNANKGVTSVAVQADGKVLVGGAFTTLQPNGAASTPRNRVARLNADGSLDTTFNPNANDTVFGIAVQADGKVLLSGNFRTLQPNAAGSATTRNFIARVNPDGSLDSTFDPNANDRISIVAVQADGKVLLGGQFTTLQPNAAGSATTRNRIARVNADGSLDTCFDPNAGGSSFTAVFTLAVQGDGKVLLGGNFTTLQPNGAASPTKRNRFARVNADGSLDTTFDPNANNSVFCVAVQADGKVSLGGFFTALQPNGAASASTRNLIARVNGDGSLDTTFDPNPDNGPLSSVAVQADGKVLLGGQFTTLQPRGAASATSRNHFARLENDAAIQTLSTPDAATVRWERRGGGPALTGQVTFEQSIDGGANYTALGSGTRVNASANPETWQLSGLSLPAGGGMLRARGRTAGGYQNGSSGIVQQVEDFGPAGSLAATLNANIAGGGSFPRVNATAVQPDGKIIIGGTFNSVGGVARNNIARLNPDGSLDMTFNPTANNTINCVAVQADGKVLLGGFFTTLQPNGAASATTRNRIARVNADGSLDTTFDPNANDEVDSVALQADGKVLLGGAFFRLQPNAAALATTRFTIARVNADGSLDSTFDPNPNDIVRSVAVQADGKVLLGGYFTTLQPNGATSATDRFHVARVNADGSLDTMFDPSPNSIVNSVAVQADGKVLLGGAFTALQPNSAASATTRNRIARVNADGSLDNTFNPNANNFINGVVEQADGKVLLFGAFTTLQPNSAASATTRNRIARVNADGSLDTTFDPNANGEVDSVGLQADGKVLLGGAFTALQPNSAASATTRNYFARLNNDAATQSLSAPDPSQVFWSRSGATPEVSQVTFERSADGGATWAPLGNATRAGTSANWQLTGLSLSGSGYLRARGRAAAGYENGSSGLIEQVQSFADTTPPSVTINQAANQSDPTISSPINFTAVFSEPVSGFDAGDITITGTAGAGATASVTQIAPNDGTTYKVAISGMTGTGTVMVSIAANGASDAAGNGNTASSSADNSVTYVNTSVQASFEVNSTADTDDGVCAPAGVGNGCTLREAINASNAAPTAKTITFNIPSSTDPGCASGVCTIAPATQLPTITNPVTIDGYTQPGASPNTNPTGGLNTVLKIELSGANSIANALSITAANTTVRGLVINQFGQNGIEVTGSGATGNVIAGNFIGTDVAGTIARGNRFAGIRLEGGPTGNIVGGDFAAARNLISGQSAGGAAGVLMRISTTSMNVVAGNLIGLNAAGTAAIANTVGVTLARGADNNRIGTNADGTNDVAERNVVSGSTDTGIVIAEVSGTVVAGNYVGLNGAGTAAIPNNKVGIIISDGSNNRIGTNADGVNDVAERNVVSGADRAVVVIGKNNVVAGNYIGTNPAGDGPLGTTNTGIVITASGSNNTIGGTAAGAGNVIAFNTGVGLAVPFFDSIGNRLLGNSIFSNGGVGIDLGTDGVTPNDAGDVDTDGANHLQNFPVLSAASRVDASTVRIGGTLDSVAGDTYRIEFFSNPTCDASGYGEGRKFLGALTGVPPNQRFTFDTTTPVEGEALSATATNERTGDTSEFAACFAVDTIPPMVTINQAAGQPDPVTNPSAINFTAIFSEPVTGFDASDVRFSGAGATMATVTETAPNNRTTYNVAISGMKGTGVVTASIIAGAAQDAAGNSSTASTSTDNQVTVKGATTTAVISSVNPSDFGQNVTFTATVTSNWGTPTGTVQFKFDGANVGSPVTLDSTGKATYMTSTLSSGNHTVSADFLGDANFNASSGSLSGGQTVKTAPTLAINDVSVAEGNSGTTPASFTVTLSAASSVTVKVDYATANGTATAPSDYQASSGTVTFAPGDTTKTVTVLVNGDTTFEADETFAVNLTNAQNATISGAAGTGTIRNDDGSPTIQFSAADYSVSEGGGNATVTVTRTGATELASTVSYSMLDGTATNGADYIGNSGTLTFTPTETSKTISIPINDDTIDEPDEYFQVVLSSPTGATLGTPPAATVTIIDNDPLPTVQFSSATYSVNENGGNALLTITRTGGKSSDAVVHVTSKDGTAQAGSDYTAFNADVTFPTGVNTQTIGIPIIDDKVAESSETFSVTLSASNTANVGTPATATVTIIDNDSASPTPSPSPSASPSPTASPSPSPSPSASPAKAVNISTRVQVGTGENAMIGGFIITGNAPKKLIIRGIGPSLAAQHVPGPLADPVLELHGPDGSLIVRNDNWKDTQQKAIEDTQLAPTNDAESAIVAVLQPGNYTAIVTGTGSTTGAALVEVYDLEPAADSTLANISTRGQVLTGDGRMFGGFMLRGGATDSDVVIRALGPSLTQAGVQNALGDPTLDLRDSNGTRVLFNDNWTDDADNAAALTSKGLAPKNPKESAVELTLPAGDYSVIVGGVNDTTGIGLIEVYNLR